MQNIPVSLNYLLDDECVVMNIDMSRSKSARKKMMYFNIDNYANKNMKGGVSAYLYLNANE